MKAGTAAGLVLLAAFTAWTAWRAATTDGFLEADEVLHFLYARHAPEVPTNFVHPWGRPLYTLLLFPFSLGGIAGSRLLAVAGGTAAAAFAWLAGRALGWRTAACAIPFTFAQPLFFQQTAGIWTEVVFAGFLGAWILALATGRNAWLAILGAALPLLRPEGFVIAFLTAVLAAFALLRDRGGRRYLSLGLQPELLILPLGLVGWWLAALFITGTPWWLMLHWPRNWGASASYGRGSWLWVLDALRAVVPASLLPLAAIGCFSPGMRRAWPVVAVIAAVLGTHGALWAAGAFGTAGYARYFVTLAPAFGLLIAGGVEVASRVLRFVPGPAWTGLATAASVALLIAHPTATVRPPLPPDAKLFAAVGRWIRTQDRDPAVLSLHPFAYLELPRVPADRFDDFSVLDPKRIAQADAGTWLLDEDRFLRLPPGGIAGGGWRRVDVPDLGVSLEVTDPRHDAAIEHMDWSLWRMQPR